MKLMWGCSFREKEAVYLEKMNEGIAKGTAWERITELIGLENPRKCEWYLHLFNALKLAVSCLPALFV